MADPDLNFSGAHYFEGVEKLLEIWFSRTDGNLKNCDLRKIPRKSLESLLKIVHCEVISFMQNDQVDAYVLSESSMFVSQRRFILKTCGTTTPLQCLDPLLLLVEQFAGFDSFEEVFYSRKNFKRPDLQKTPHRSFDQEVALLKTIFKDGHSYCLGERNSDCWYLFTLNALDSQKTGRHEPDQTLEILMSDLDPEVMSIFTQEKSSSAEEATKINLRIAISMDMTVYRFILKNKLKLTIPVLPSYPKQKSGIDKIIPSMWIDDYLFEPCGYSMNGITKVGHYMTIHITPEPDFSYVSFETNVPQASYKDIINRVVDIFKPGKVVVTIFANKESLAAGTGVNMEKLSYVRQCEKRAIQYCRLKNYDLTYTFYSKFPS